MPSTQFSFGIRTASSVKTVHLLGSWDNYHGQLPLSKDKTASKSGSWKGTFRFSTSVLQPGKPYWYYFIIDGYHVSHNPAEESTVEPTTGRSLNILHTDGNRSKSSSSSHSSGSSSSSRSSHTTSSSSSSSSGSSKSSSRRKDGGTEIPSGRPLSISQIKAPKPISPTATTRAQLLAENPDPAAIEALNAQFYATSLDTGDSGYEYDYYENEDYDTMLSSPTSTSSSRRSRGSSRGSSVSGFSSPDSTCSSAASCCSCERFGITRKGERVRIDCGGSRCGYDSSASSLMESDEDRNAEAYYREESPYSDGSRKHSSGSRSSSKRESKSSSSRSSSKRHGVVVR